MRGVLDGAVLETHAVDGQQSVSGLQGARSESGKASWKRGAAPRLTIGKPRPSPPIDTEPFANGLPLL